jgi:hypothetical protein
MDVQMMQQYLAARGFNYGEDAAGNAAVGYELRDAELRSAKLQDGASTKTDWEHEAFCVPGGLYLFHDDPDRVYEVVAVSNTAFRCAGHPPQVIYRTRTSPERWWTRTPRSFHEFFTRVLDFDAECPHG